MDTDLRALAKIVALPPVAATHSGGGHTPQQRSDTVRLSHTAEILQLNDGDSITPIARALGLAGEDVEAALTTGRYPFAATRHLVQPLLPLTPAPLVAEPPRPLEEILADTTRNTSGNLFPTLVPMAASQGEAPALAGPTGMTNPTIERRHRSRRRKDRRAQSDLLCRWPLSETYATSTNHAANPWFQVEQDNLLEAVVHEWTDAEGTSIPGGRLSLQGPAEEIPEGILERTA